MLYFDSFNCVQCGTKEEKHTDEKSTFVDR
jgi:hypothetical protein